MNEIKVDFWQTAPIGLQDISDAMEVLPKHSVEFTPWIQFPYKPHVQFAIAYDSKHIFVKYYVWERNIRLTVKQTNGPVWEDSCVEFFIAFKNGRYYNIEANCIGTVTGGYGTNKSTHKLLPLEAVNKIKCQSQIFQKARDLFYWELVLSIPTDIFLYDQPFSLKGQRIKCNFCKCGDALPNPHFLSWSPIESPQPDFHLPQFFNTLEFTDHISSHSTVPMV